jgi:hypothetical protein
MKHRASVPAAPDIAPDMVSFWIRSHACFLRGFLLGCTDSVYYRTESVSPLRSALQFVPNVSLVIIVLRLGIP